MMIKNKNWLVFANNKKCRHAEAIRDLGFINWTMGKRFHFAIGDSVYLFMSNERKIRYKMIVVAMNCEREDQKYWIEAPNDKTYKLQLVKEYDGDLLTEDKLREYGFCGGGSLQNPNYRNKKLIEYINTIFDLYSFSRTCLQKSIAQKPMLIVDLNSGSYLKAKEGHEKFNLERNPINNKFCGYCPPDDNINILKLGAKTNEESISGVVVVYTTKQKDSSDREIIAFCEDATVHRKGIDTRSLNNRIINDHGKMEYCTYTIESDTLINLTTVEPKFKIKIADYNSYMFRKQRIFKGSYPILDKRIQEYIQSYLNYRESVDDLLYQEQIQGEEDCGANDQNDSLTEEPQYLAGSDSKSVKRKPRNAKLSLSNSQYKCMMDASHKTFKTSKGLPYMEGHHLIPCTYANAEYFWATKKRNIDCKDNIICLCPTCHRKIHYASIEEKKAMIGNLYKLKKERFCEIGLDISLDELFNLYGI